MSILFGSIQAFIAEEESVVVVEHELPVMNPDGNTFNVTFMHESKHGSNILEATKTYNLFLFLDFVYEEE